MDTGVGLRPGAVAWARVGDETVVLDIETSEYLELNAVASLLLTELDRGCDRDDLIRRLEAEYGIDSARAESDVTQFLAACSERGWLVL